MDLKRILMDKDYTSTKGIKDMHTLVIARMLYYLGILCVIFAIIAFILNRVIYNEWQNAIDESVTIGGVSPKIIINTTYMPPPPNSPEIAKLAYEANSQFGAFILLSFAVYICAFLRIGVIVSEKERMENDRN